MNKPTAKGIANAIWHMLTVYYPNNMVELSQFRSYYEVRFFGDTEENDLAIVADQVVCKELENVHMHTNVYNVAGDWCLHIEVEIEREE